MHLCGDQHLAEDLAQEAMLRAVRDGCQLNNLVVLSASWLASTSYRKHRNDFKESALGKLPAKLPEKLPEKFVDDRRPVGKTIRSVKNSQAVPFAIRVLWLSNDPVEDNRNTVEPDAALAKSIEKLAELGFANMKVKMQLLGRCDIIQGKATSQIEGSLVSGTTRRTLSAEVKLSNENAPIHGAFTLLAGVSTHPNADGVPEKASVDVAINLELNKYYVLSATPVGGYQTAFVVQLVDGL